MAFASYPCTGLLHSQIPPTCAHLEKPPVPAQLPPGDPPVSALAAPAGRTPVPMRSRPCIASTDAMRLLQEYNHKYLRYADYDPSPAAFCK